ncbi:SipW-dependent-type signal peptide-containing protein [Rhodococcus erythropolis]
MSETYSPATLLRRIVDATVSVRGRVVLSFGMIVGLGAVGTLAAWSDTSTATSGTFTTGAIDLQINGSQGRPTAYTFSALNSAAAALLPGRSAAAALTVQNRQNLAFTYTMNVSGSGTIGPGLILSVFEKSTPTAGAGSTTCVGGTQIAAVNLSTAAQPIGSAPRPVGTGPTTRDDVLCIQLTLPATAPNTVQGATGKVIVTFEGTSV